MSSSTFLHKERVIGGDEFEMELKIGEAGLLSNVQIVAENVECVPESRMKS